MLQFAGAHVRNDWIVAVDNEVCSEVLSNKNPAFHASEGD